MSYTATLRSWESERHLSTADMRRDVFQQFLPSKYPQASQHGFQQLKSNVAKCLAHTPGDANMLKSHRMIEK